MSFSIDQEKNFERFKKFKDKIKYENRFFKRYQYRINIYKK